MKIKTKLTLGIGLLFVLIILLAAVSSVYIVNLQKDTKNILTANYNTLEYARNMLLALDDMDVDPQAASVFEVNLHKQKNNQTEIGEREATDKIAVHFSDLKAQPTNTTLQVIIRKDITELMRLNMEAIERKSDVANETAESAIVWISITGALCFLIAFILVVNLPGTIANPIRELSESIKQIAAQNYHQRVHFDGHSEFGELARSFNTMAQRLEEYANSKLDKLLKEKKRIETLINNMHDPVVGIDENKKILFVNDEALKISGLQTQDLIGKQIQDVSVQNDLIRSLIKDLMQPDKCSSTKDPIKIYANNKESYFEKEIIDINIIPTGESALQLIGHVIVLRNITPFKELDFAKTNFIATVSHELKTPIAAIQLSIDILKHRNTGDMNQEQLLLVESIKDDSHRLLKITGELLNMSQVESGNIQLNMQLSDSLSIIHYAVSATKSQADQKNIIIQTLIAANLPLVMVDAEKTAWVLTNFITNAIRYSTDNSEIIVSLKRDQNHLVFAVQDFGSGIEPRYQERIFERYFQIPGSSKTGTGLGLAISKDFIETQGGRIGLKSEQGLGSTFYFEFPM